MASPQSIPIPNPAWPTLFEIGASVVSSKSPGPEKIGLTVYLIRGDQAEACKRELVTKTSLRLREPLSGHFVPLLAREAEPSWFSAVRYVLEEPPTSFTLTAQSPAGLLLVHHAARLFAVSFGHAWLKLKDEWLEQDFGRRVALSSISRNQILELRSEQVFAKWHIANDRAPQATSVEEFGVDFDRDLIGAVEGLSSHSAFGKTIRGGASFHVKGSLCDLGAILDTASELFSSDTYKQVWPEIETITRIEDKAKQAELESRLDSELASGQAQKAITLFTPASKRGDNESVHAYVFGRLSASPASTPYLNIGGWDAFLQRKGLQPSVASARECPVHLLDEGGQVLRTYKAFDCFGYELSVDGRQYVLSSGTWYEAVPEFISRINSAVAEIPAPPISIPRWNQIDNEGAYNLATAVSNGFLHFDAKNIVFGGGQSKFEWCDLVHLESKTLIFVKNASRSSGISHLVEQVRRTAELFFSTDLDYRRRLRAVFAKHHPRVNCDFLDCRPKNGEWNLCLVSLGKPALKLPFFARCALARVCKELTERGHAVSFVSV